MKRYPHNRDFQNLAIQVNRAIVQNDGKIGDQRQQVELVYRLEQQFKKAIKRYNQTNDIYKKFVDFILNDLKNTLSAEPYFREKKSVFSAKISKAIKREDYEDLTQYDINYQLINFIVKNWKGKLPKRVQEIYDQFIEARRILIENNLPLAINRAKLFFRKTPQSHLTLLDLIDICTYGLVSGVDKYAGEYSEVWRSVCIGRMVGYMIEEYSKTFIRMYPKDRKILYRANSLKHKLKIEKIEDLTKAVNESFEEEKKLGKKCPKLPISEIYIRTLLNGTGYTSADTQISDSEDNDMTIYDYTEDERPNPEEALVTKDLMSKVSTAAKDLGLIEKKIIRLKGVDL